MNANHSIFTRNVLATLLTVALVLLTACQPAALPTPTSEPTPPPVATHTPLPSPTTALQPSPTGDNPLSSKDPIVAAVISALAGGLNVDNDAVTPLSKQAVQWPDACLGVPVVEMMCAAVITDGFRVTLSVNDLVYAAHTNADASNVILLPGPAPEPAGLTYSYRQDGACQAVMARPDRIAFGPCFGDLQVASFADPVRADELTHFIETYESFLYAVPSGLVHFIGSGSTPATPAEQRSVAAWAQMVSTEVKSGRVNGENGLLFTWRREGGIAGFCDGLAVYASGAAIASSCRSEPDQEVARGWLTADQLEQTYEWSDTFSRFEYAPDSGATADAMIVVLDFMGTGSTAASADEQQAIVAFAQALFTQIVRANQ